MRNPLACEAEVTEAWFLPHFSPQEDRPYEMAMYRIWVKDMKYEDHYNGEWSSKMASMLVSIPRALNERGSRVAVTFAIWLMTPMGVSFLETLFRDQNNRDSSSSLFIHESERLAIHSWAYENRLSGCTVNRLNHLLQDTQGVPIYTNPPYPTLEDSRVVEHLCCFFVGTEGRDLLRRVYRSAARKTDNRTTRKLPF